MGTLKTTKSTKSLVLESFRLYSNIWYIFECLLIFFIVPTINFEQSVYTANENVKLQPVLVLTGLSSIDITIQVSTTDGSAVGKH